MSYNEGFFLCDACKKPINPPLIKYSKIVTFSGDYKFVDSHLYFCITCNNKFIGTNVVRAVIDVMNMEEEVE